MLTITLLVVVVCLLLWPDLLWRLEAWARRRLPVFHGRVRWLFHRYRADLEHRYPRRNQLR